MRTKLPTPDMEAYSVYYETYAPRLWGIILQAGLPQAQAKQILIRTLTIAWQQREEYPFTSTHFLSRLIGLAHREGLPLTHLHSKLKEAVRVRS